MAKYGRMGMEEVMCEAENRRGRVSKGLWSGSELSKRRIGGLEA